MSATPPYQPILDRKAWADLRSRCRFVIRGTDAARYLNGQLTNQVSDLDETMLQHQLVLSAKGRMEGELFLRKRGEEYLLDADESLREILPARLDRYIIADDVEIEDVTESTVQVHLFGSASSPDIPGILLRESMRYILSGHDVVAEANQTDALESWLVSCGPSMGEPELEAFRLEMGLPRWGRELGPDVLPPEAGLDATAIHYAKGCYIGQEVISRLRSVGRVNRTLCGFSSDTPLQPDWPIFAEPEEGKPIGRITSCGHSFTLDKPFALGYVKIPFAEPGNTIWAAESIDSKPSVRLNVHETPLIKL